MTNKIITASFMHPCIGPALADHFQSGLANYFEAAF